MDGKLFRTLLYGSEGPDLDFKRDQYAFIGADDKSKSELLKDILTFANSWRRSDAYILIGVEPLGDGRNNPVGIPPAEHIDDASLQQFVNSKTNRKIEFSYEPFYYDGLSFGIITIPKQKRPVYANKDYGIVKAREVYYRQGSSCAVATTDDIYQMGLDDGKGSQSKPVIRLELADLEHRKTLGTNISLKTINHAPHKKTAFPKEDSNRDWRTLFTHSYTNSEYWRELADYLVILRAFTPVGFAAINPSEELAKRVRLEIVCPKEVGLTFKEKREMPKFPRDSMSRFGPIFSPQILDKNAPSVHKYQDRWLVIIEFGDIQPKATSWSVEPISVSAPASGTYSLTARIYADNIPHPQEEAVKLDFEVEARPALTMDDLSQVDYEALEKDLEKYRDDDAENS